MILETALGHLAPNSKANASMAMLASILFSARVISLMAPFALRWTLLRSESRTFALLSTQFLWWRVLGKTYLRALQNPRAQSPTANTGALIPRFLRSLKNTAYDSVDSR